MIGGQKYPPSTPDCSPKNRFPHDRQHKFVSLTNLQLILSIASLFHCINH